jgi:PAS domain S-box-containing protein
VLARGKSAVLFHRHADGSVKVAFLARAQATSASPALGLVVLELDPNRWLYPFLAMRPMVAESAESVLMRREGEDIVFLSPLRGKPNTPLIFRRPANLPRFAALAAIEGRQGFGEYVDYRNEPVFATAVRLDRASCGLVVKIDQREALAPYHRAIRRAGVTAATSLIGFWAVALLLFRAWRKRAEYRQELEHSLLQTMVERPDDVIVFSLDASYRYTAFNEKHRLEMKKVWNADIEVGMSLLDCMRVPELRSLAKESMDRALRGEAFWEEQHQADLDIYYEFSWNPVRLGEKIVGVAAFVRDITERRREAAAVRESEARLRAVLDAAPFPVALVDVEDNKIEFWSRSALSLFGHTAPTAVEWYEIAYPDPAYRREVIERWKAALERARATGKTVNTGEYRVTCRDGSVRLCELYATFLPDTLVVTFNDITERQRAEEMLRESEQRLRRFYESGLLGVLFWNTRGQVTDANDKFLEMVGYSRSELAAGRIDWVNMTPPEYRHLDEASVVELKATGVNRTPFEKEYVRKDGTRIPILIAGAMLDDERVNGVAFVLDISDRKRAEHALRAALTRQQALLAAVPDIVMEVDASKVYTWANPAGIEFFGADVVGHEAASYFEGEQDTYDRVRPVFQGDDQTIYVESWQRRRDGERRLLAWWCRSLKDDAGNMTGALSTARDITERQRAEAELHEKSALLEAQANSTIDGILVVDDQGRKIFQNQRTVELWKIPPEIANDSDDKRQVQHVMQSTKHPERFVEQIVYLYGHPDETSRDEIELVDGTVLDRYSAPVLGKDGKNYGRVWTFRDITGRKRAEAELAGMNAELERRVAERTAELTVSNQELESFAYAVSHDLRAPLRGIDGWSQAVLEDYGHLLDEQGRKYLDTVRTETQRMARLIDDLLDLSRVARAPMARESIDLTAMAHELEAILRAEQPGRAVDFVVAPGIVARGDAVLLRTALQNLLHNAWKFTGRLPRPRIEVGCATEEKRTVYHVRDNGVGFDMRFAGKLFAPFQRLHGLAEFPGTGIGLATVQRIIHRHGGKVWATAEVDRGATFYFTLSA